jgi:hypothetical protein
LGYRFGGGLRWPSVCRETGHRSVYLATIYTASLTLSSPSSTYRASMALPTTRTHLTELPFDILDYIFSLISDSGSLVACSKAHPSFSTIAEKHLYFHIIIPTSTDIVLEGPGPYFLEPSHLVKLISETPQIVNHVRVLHIAFSGQARSAEMSSYEEIALILPMFPALEFIALTTLYAFSWQDALPQILKTAVEDCLRLPTLRLVHVGDLQFPLSMLNSNAHIDFFSLSQSLQMPDFPDDTDSHLQLKSLVVEDIETKYRPSFSTWAKRHIVNLQCLSCDYSDDQTVLELLQVCSGTLNNLELKIQSPCEAISLLAYRL